MSLEPTTDGTDSIDVGPHRFWIGKLTVGHPELDNAKVFFGRNVNPGDAVVEGLVATDGIAYHTVGELFPGVNDDFVGDFVREISAVLVLGIFVDGSGVLA